LQKWKDFKSMGVGGCQVVGRAIAIFGIRKKRKKEIYGTTYSIVGCAAPLL
jgi:hypothetical protein